MSFSDWLHHTAAQRVLGGIAAFVIAGVVAWLLWPDLPPVPQRQALEDFKTYYQSLEPECASLSTDELAAPPDQAQECKNRKAQEKKEYRDLAQSIRASNAAEEAAWLSYLQTRAAIVGAAFVVLTLGATAWAAWAAADAAEIAEKSALAAQQSVEEARKATRFAQVSADAAREALAITDRAWIKIEVELTDPLAFGPQTITTSARFTFRNIGKGPATNISTIVSFHIDELDAGEDARKRASEPMILSAIRHLGIGKVLFPDESHIEERALEISTADFKSAIVEANRRGSESDEPYTVTTEHPCILAGVSYFLPGDRTRRFTFSPFQIRSASDRHPGWDGAEGEFVPAELTLRLGFMGGFVK